jgi:tetratricopeptide (TPR) repeat protein
MVHAFSNWVENSSSDLSDLFAARRGTFCRAVSFFFVDAMSCAYCLQVPIGARMQSKIMFRIMSRPFASARVVYCLAVVFILLACLAGVAAAQGDPRQTAAQLQQEGRFTEAEAAWRAIVQTHPTDAEAYANLGLLEARQEHYKEAVLNYHKALAINPAMTGVRLDLGLSLFKGGELHAADQTFEQLLKTTPQNSEEALRLKTLIGLAHYGVGEYTAAIPYLKTAAASDPQNLPFRLALAQSCLWSRQYQCVLDVYHEILTLNANSAEADMLAGEALDEMKDKPGAVEQFRAAVKADPRMPNVHFGLGYLLWDLQQYDEAGREFQAELDNNPSHAQALTYLADSDMRLNHTEPAQALLEKAIQLDPKIERAHLDLGILFSDGGKSDDALRELKIAERLSPGDQDVHWRLGRFYKLMGKNEEAKAEFDKTRSLQKTADETVFNQLHRAQQGPPAPYNPEAPLQ